MQAQRGCLLNFSSPCFIPQALWASTVSWGQPLTTNVKYHHMKLRQGAAAFWTEETASSDNTPHLRRLQQPCAFLPRELKNGMFISYGLDPILTAWILLTVIFYRMVCVISNMCQAMCSLFTNYLISSVCSLRYRQCNISLFPAFQNKLVYAKYFQKFSDGSY